jgi:hypothetical protein
MPRNVSRNLTLFWQSLFEAVKSEPTELPFEIPPNPPLLKGGMGGISVNFG